MRTFKTCLRLGPFAASCFSEPSPVEATSAYWAARNTALAWPEADRKEVVRVHMASADLGHEGESLGWQDFDVHKCADGRMLVAYSGHGGTKT